MVQEQLERFLAKDSHFFKNQIKRYLGVAELFGKKIWLGFTDQLLKIMR